MFYSHQLLARKAPLGQIWRAATLHAKINRRNLNKLNIINICEEILNPSVPMALRLSGILMGGVVIVYERKVKLLYEDVTRLLVEINEAWRVKAKRDPTVLPKGKSQAKYEDVTLPANQPADLGDLEQHLQFSNSDTLMGMHKSAYIDMNLDNIDDSYISHNQGDADLPHDHHQADIENITLFDRFDSHQTDAGRFKQFERFDIEGDDINGDDVTLEKDPSYNHSLDLPNTLIPSPPLQDEPKKPDEIHEQHPEYNTNHQSDEDKAQHVPNRQKPSRKRARRVPSVIMDYEQTMIPGNMYQSWLQDASDLGSRRGRKIKHLSSIRSMKTERLMDLPPVALVEGLFTNENRDICYPLPLLKQWTKLTQPAHDSPSVETSPPHPPAPSSTSPPEATNYHDPTTFPFEDHHSGVGSGSLGVSIEKQMPYVNNYEIPEIISTVMNNGLNVSGANGGPVADADVAVTPANSDGGVKSMSSGSGPGFVPDVSDTNSGRSNNKRLFSSGRKSGSGLEPVAEELFNQTDPNFKLAQLSENELSPEKLIVESGPTQTQKVPPPDQPMEQLTDSIRMQLKAHFDTPGCAQTESLNQLALGLDRKKAACLFYQTLVLATRDIIKVYQKEPYGNIVISRGAKM
ncbi:sister chromatid cohesion 1 protein 1 isoform X1 [Helianthus annuus]|uniref:sister chromatid cohesion 1 protein 1 isoform X1 n=1 Tax=Helianthus annuus TaxID=4232 RepID=UPI000B90546B|nr:sister chromatid cohesion 1 protein 1 isoform X1 [Helianthus annuus]